MAKFIRVEKSCFKNYHNSGYHDIKFETGNLIFNLLDLALY